MTTKTITHDSINSRILAFPISGRAATRCLNLAHFNSIINKYCCVRDGKTMQLQHMYFILYLFYTITYISFRKKCHHILHCHLMPISYKDIFSYKEFSSTYLHITEMYT